MKPKYMMLLLLLFFSRLHAQQFYKQYSNSGQNGGGNYYFKGKRLIAPTANNGIIFTGGDNQGNLNVTFLNAEGCTVWTKSYNFGLTSNGTLVKQLADNSFIVAGSLSDGSAIVQKITTTGNIIWATKYNVADGYPSSPTDLSQTGNELAFTDGQFNNSNLTHIVKIDQSNGNILSIQSIKRLPVDGSDSRLNCSIYRIVSPSYGGYFLAGQLDYTPGIYAASDRRAVLIYMDNAGNISYCKTFSTAISGSNICINELMMLPYNDLLMVMEVFSDGSYIPAFPNSGTRIVLTKMDNFGGIYFQKFYDQTYPATGYIAYTFPNSIAVTDNGGFMVSGISDDSHSASSLDFVFKTDPNGNVINNSMYKFVTNNTLGMNSLFKTPANDFIANFNGDGIRRFNADLDSLCNITKIPFTAQNDNVTQLNYENVVLSNVPFSQTNVNPIPYNTSQTILTKCGEECEALALPCHDNSTLNLAGDLLAYYPFGDGSTNDYSGNGHHLTIMNGAHPAEDRNGNPDCAFEFDNLPLSNNQYLTTTSTSFLNNLSEYSISLWYKPKDSSRRVDTYETLLGRDYMPGVVTPYVVGATCPDRTGQWSLGLYDCRYAVFGRDNSVWQTYRCDAVCAVDTNTGAWHHLTATYNAIGPTFKLYRDGVLQGNDITNFCQPGYPSTGMAACGSPISIQDIGDIFIGKDYTGTLDDIFIYNRELSVGEINQLYNLSSSCCNYNTLTTSVQICPGNGNTNVISNIYGTSYQWQLNNGTGYLNITNNANYSGCTSSVLNIQNIPSSYYGYTYRCLANGSYSNPVMIKFSNIWTGAISNSWENAGNWSCNSVPDGNTDVIVNSGTVIVNSNATCRSIYLNSGVNFTVNPVYIFTVTH